ncbi:MAG: helix-turn-helix domain-containing protein [Solirubrobacteraceae bacterium]
MPAAGPDSRTSAGSDLRAERERLGVSRARLAGLANCSLASLGGIEQGACPRHSKVLERAWAALNGIEKAAGGRDRVAA